jgi:hypothetical protein
MPSAACAGADSVRPGHGKALQGGDRLSRRRALRSWPPDGSRGQNLTAPWPHSLLRDSNSDHGTRDARPHSWARGQLSSVPARGQWLSNWLRRRQYPSGGGGSSRRRQNKRTGFIEDVLPTKRCAGGHARVSAGVIEQATCHAHTPLPHLRGGDPRNARAGRARARRTTPCFLQHGGAPRVRPRSPALRSDARFANTWQGPALECRRGEGRFRGARRSVRPPRRRDRGSGPAGTSLRQRSARVWGS